MEFIKYLFYSSKDKESYTYRQTQQNLINDKINSSIFDSIEEYIGLLDEKNILNTDDSNINLNFDDMLEFLNVELEQIKFNDINKLLDELMIEFNDTTSVTNKPNNTFNILDSSINNDTIQIFDNIVVDNEQFMDDIIKNSGYTKDIDIYRQALSDFERQIIEVNSVRMNSFDEFIKTVCKMTNNLPNDKTDKQIKSGDITINISYSLLAVLLTCQSSFYLQYRMIHDKLEDEKNKLMTKLMSKDTSINNDDRLNYFVLNSPDTYNTINIIVDNDTNTFGAVLTSHFRIADISKEENIFFIKSEYQYHYNNNNNNNNNTNNNGEIRLIATSSK